MPDDLHAERRGRRGPRRGDRTQRHAATAGDVAGRRVALDAMLGYFNNQAQPVAGKVDISDHSVSSPNAELPRA